MGNKYDNYFASLIYKEWEKAPGKDVVIYDFRHFKKSWEIIFEKAGFQLFEFDFSKQFGSTKPGKFFTLAKNFRQ